VSHVHINVLWGLKIVFMNKYFIFYHIFLEENWREIVKEQLEVLVNSGLLKFSSLFVSAVYNGSYDVNNMKTELDNLLGVCEHYELISIERNGCCGESTTLKKVYETSKNLEEGKYILYFHAKGITQHNTPRELPVKKWREMMEYYLITKWEDCVNKLEEGYDCCGINYQNHAGRVKNETKLIKIFNGNFFWAKSEYIKKLDDSILFEHRYSAENWILSESHNCFSFFNVPPSFDLYYNIYEDYKT
jgi:hypothetical protein